MEVLGEERGERGQQPSRRPEGVRERVVRDPPVGRVGVRPEPRPGPPEVPRAEVVDEIADRRGSLPRVERIERARRVPDRLVEARQEPPVEETRRLRRLAGRPEAVGGRVLPVEGVDVEERPEDPGGARPDVALPQFRRLGVVGGQERPPDGVAAVLLEETERFDRVPLRLAHLLARVVEDQAVRDRDLVRGPVEQAGREDEHRVEPPTGLVEPLGHEVERAPPGRTAPGSNG